MSEERNAFVQNIPPVPLERLYTTVNEDETPGVSVTRETLPSCGRRFRVSCMFFVRKKAQTGVVEILIAQRSSDRKIHPHCWGPSASGTVEHGETCVENCVKEVREELGVILTSEQLYHVVTRKENDRLSDDITLRYFLSIYACFVDESLAIKTNPEVQNTRWIGIDEIQDNGGLPALYMLILPHMHTYLHELKIWLTQNRDKH